MKSRLEIFGPYPPPLGGISLHLKRMEFFLEKEKIEYVIYNHGTATGPKIIATKKSIFWYVKYIFSNRGAVIHFHQFFKFHYLYYFIFSWVTRKRIIVTIHEENMLYYPAAQQSAVVWLLKHSRLVALISVSEKLYSFLKAKTVDVIWLPAYVPAMRIDFKPLTSENGKPFFLYSVWKLQRDISERIYNVPLAFKLLSALKSRYNMLFLIGTEAESDKSYLNELIHNHDVTGSITILYEAQLTDYVKNCEFLLRTNLVDGFGVSLQEAMDQDVPAVASDVCVRPDGTVLFKSGDFDDLLEKVSNLRANLQNAKQSSPRYHQTLINLYKENLKN